MADTPIVDTECDLHIYAKGGNDKTGPLLTVRRDNILLCHDEPMDEALESIKRDIISELEYSAAMSE